MLLSHRPVAEKDIQLICGFPQSGNERRPKVGALHRIVFGAVCGVAIASIYSSPSAGFALGALVGGTLGYIGIHWAKYVQF